jgi:LytR cell envelope-related transcriptional attenuator
MAAERNTLGISHSGPWVRPLILGMSCLMLGFVGGWVLKGGGGNRNNLPKLSGEYTKAVTTPPPARTVTGDGQTVSTQTDVALAAPDRSQVVIAILNATSTTGLAANKATQIRTLGYETVSTGNAPTTPGASVVYFRPSRRASAQQAASDLGIAQITPLPATGAISNAAAEFQGAHVVVVLRTA